MNGETTNDFQTLYETMKKYNFNEPYKVSVTIEEDGHEVELLDKTNNAFVSPESNIYTGIFNTQLSPTSPVTESLLPQDTTLPSHPTAVMCRLTSSQLKQAQQNHIFKNMNLLANNIIHILKEYASYISYWDRCGKNELLKENCTKKYIKTKEYYMNISRDIVRRTILPQGNKFDEIGFLRRTAFIANQHEKLRCGYKCVEIIYKQILSSCYEQVSNYEETQSHSSNRINNEQILSQQRDLQRNTVIQKSINTPESIMYQNPHTYLHSNNLTRIVSYGHTSARQEYSTVDRSCNNNTNQTNNHQSKDVIQTVYEGPNSILQPNYQNNYPSSDVIQTGNEHPNSILQSRYQNNHQLSHVVQTIHAGSNSILQPNYQNNHQSRDVIQTVDRANNLAFQKQFENNRNHSTRKENASNQNMCSVAPTTCVFQYRNSDYEVRLDVNTQILNNVNKNSQINKNLQIDDLAYINNQNTSDTVGQAVQSAETLNAAAIMPFHDMPLIQQEPIRSMSRDSGFISPCNNLINDSCNVKDMHETTCPDITYVTSLNPDAVQIPRGPCHVCGEVTKKKCRGCYKYYYCTPKCQNQHWSVHKFECTNTT